MNTIICPHCHKSFELNEVLTHQIEEELLAGQEKKHEEELAKIKKQLEVAQNAELEIRKQKNTLDEEKRTFELDKQRQLDLEREKIRKATQEEMLESQKLKELEKEKIINDLKKSLEDAQRKATQGSQQLQGEVQELDLEATLRSNFPSDSIEPIGKGVNGADIRQIVKTQRGNVCGTILWESKRTKAWSDGWIAKLKEDMRNDKANISAIVSEVLPDEAKNGMGLKEGVWVCTPKLIVPLGMLLHKVLEDTARQKHVTNQQQTKAEEIAAIVTSLEFVQRLESMREIYTAMLEQITKERIAYEKSWKLREAQAQHLLKGVAGIYGQIQGAAGPALPPIKDLELDA